MSCSYRDGRRGADKQAVLRPSPSKPPYDICILIRQSPPLQKPTVTRRLGRRCTTRLVHKILVVDPISVERRQVG